MNIAVSPPIDANHYKSPPEKPAAKRFVTTPTARPTVRPPQYKASHLA